LEEEPEEPPDGEPPDEWKEEYLEAWDWRHTCRCDQFSSKSWSWVDDIRDWFCANDANLTFVSATRRSPEAKVLAWGNCVGPGGDYIYMYDVVILRRASL
jgi:hypothetical protein